jgi:hypothetical protein
MLGVRPSILLICDTYILYKYNISIIIIERINFKIENNTRKIRMFEYMNVDLIDEELRCVICTRPFYLLVYFSQCGHTFCQPCIQKWLENFSSCPTCRHDVTINDYTPVKTRVVLNQLSRIRMKCNLCEQTNIDDRNTHEEICLKKIIKCTSSNLKCQWTGKREDLDLHLKTCPFTQIRPIMDQLINQMKIIRETQVEQQRFLKAFTNNGYTLSSICTVTFPCYLSHPRLPNTTNLIPCSLCNNKILPMHIAVHSCRTITCICKFCFEKHTQQITSLTLKSKSSSSEQSNDDNSYRRYNSLNS